MLIDQSKVNQLPATHQFFQSTILNCHEYLIDLKLRFRFNFSEFPSLELSDFQRTVLSEVKFDSKMIQYDPID